MNLAHKKNLYHPSPFTCCMEQFVKSSGLCWNSRRKSEINLSKKDAHKIHDFVFNNSLKMDFVFNNSLKMDVIYF